MFHVQLTVFCGVIIITKSIKESFLVCKKGKLGYGEALIMIIGGIWGEKAI